MNEFIFTAQNNRSSNEVKQNEFYTVTGSHDSLDEKGNPRLSTETKDLCAKKLYREDGSFRFYVRLANNGSIYNPVSVYGEEKPNKFLDRVVRDGFKFKEVNNKIFDMYLSFLKTKNVAWLHNVEREMI
jgi:hypothetical protein